MGGGPLMRLKDILDKFEYNNVIYKDDENLVVENYYRTVVSITINPTKKEYEATIPNKYGIDESDKIKSNNYNEFLKLLEAKLESREPFKNIKYLP